MSIVKETGELMADFNISLSLKEEEEGEVQQSDLYDDIGGGTADLTNPPLPYGADISTEMRESALKNVDLRRRKVHDRPVNPRSNIGRNSPASAFFRYYTYYAGCMCLTPIIIITVVCLYNIISMQKA